MNLVETTLLENIDKPSSLFIFPTDVSASRWADCVLRLRYGGTIAMEKFMAWDTFKQKSIRSKIQNKQSIPSVLRKMFVRGIIRENAQGGPYIFSSLIKTDWAQQADSFAGWITDILPQLGTWFKRATGCPIERINDSAVLRIADSLFGDKSSSVDTSSNDDRDLYSLAYRYAQFLDRYGLFEPAWETPPFEDTGKECYIFFPESLSDFNEYRDLLEASDHVVIIHPVTDQIPCDTFFYTGSRGEITGAALYIFALHNEHNIPWDSISVSIPDRENYGPYLIREFTNRNIPYIKQSGKDLASYPAGQFFTALSDCASSQFSFSSLVGLLLNRHLPWKDGSEIQDLIYFGINNNCISSWVEEEGTKINVWEDAFTHPFGGIKTKTRRFFEDLRRRVNAICSALSFYEIRKQYFIFRERFFDMENCLDETDTVLSRCISELTYLVEIEKSFPDLRVPNPYGFFAGYLAEVNYLAQQSGSGVAILPYRTAAPAPFDCHIVLGASQGSLQAVFSPLAFMSKSKREKLGFTDNDASQVFINLHQYCSRLPAAFFCSEQTFSGYAIPHSALGMPLKPGREFSVGPQSGLQFSADLYRIESAWYASLNVPTKAEQEELSEIHSNQKRGFTEWRSRRDKAVSNGNILNPNHPLTKLIRRKFCKDKQYDNKFSVSATSLALYYKCPLEWVYARVLDLENVEITTTLMADNISGRVYPAVLNLFLEELKETGEAIIAPLGAESKKDILALPNSYHRLLAEKLDIVFESFPGLPKEGKPIMSMLTARLLRSQKPLFYSNLEKFLATFISFFSGFRVLASEAYYSLPKDFYCLNGIVDCILEDDHGMVIVDFKTKTMPKLSDYTGEDGLVDFQLPMYISLAEAAFGKEVHTALFFSIIDAAPQVVFGVIHNVIHNRTIPKKEEDIIKRGSDIFLEIMDEFDKKAEQFAREIRDSTFSLLPSRSESCLECQYNRVCRRLYSICQEKRNGN
jgi:hypothetical protein